MLISLRRMQKGSLLVSFWKPRPVDLWKEGGLEKSCSEVSSGCPLQTTPGIRKLVGGFSAETSFSALF